MDKFALNDLRNRCAMAKSKVETAQRLYREFNGDTPGFDTLCDGLDLLADAVGTLIEQVHATDRAARIANDTASMLANGIQPD